MVPTGSTGGSDAAPESAPGAAPESGSSAAGRYNRSPAGMVGALLVTLLVIGAFVAFRAFNRTDLDVKPERIDYLAQVGYAQESGATLVYPARLPQGWYATNMTYASGRTPELQLSMLTGDGQYVGFVESPQTVPELLTTYVDAHPASAPPATVSGSIATQWSAWTDGTGDTALAATRGAGANQESLLVFGTVSRAQLIQLAGSLTTASLKH